MTKSLLTGLAACAALAFVGNAYAFDNQPPHKHRIWVAENGRQGYPTQFRIPANPRVWDCVHVIFPQCSRGFDGLNDGSFK
jgi:hypothetical protein